MDPVHDASEDAPALLTWQVPVGEGQQLDLVARPGESTVILGANGTGKSALGQWLDSHSGDVSLRRVIAHRRLWFESSGPDLTPTSREQLGRNMKGWGQQSDSRWLDHANTQRPGLVLFDLIGHENVGNAEARRMYDGGAIRAEVDLAYPSPIQRINGILTRSGLGLTLELTESSTLDAVTQPGARYPITQLSDGEKSAVLLAGEVLVADKSSVIVVDEPERHLHRAISAALIDAVLAERPDCHFVVLTHDIDLAATLPSASTTVAVLSGCTWQNNEPISWDLRVEDPAHPIPESVRLAVLGGRQRVLFVEGDHDSLDVRLYSLLLPSWAHSPAGGCEAVIRSVNGLKHSERYHWVDSAGIVDGDRRSATEIAALRDIGVYPLDVLEIESLYFIERTVRAAAELQGGILDGADPDGLLDVARRAGLQALSGEETRKHLASAVAANEIQWRGLSSLPTKQTIADASSPVVISIESPFPGELAMINSYFQAGDLDSMIRNYPIRETSLPDKIAGALGFKSVDHYRRAVHKLVSLDEVLATDLRSAAGELPG